VALREELTATAAEGIWLFERLPYWSGVSRRLQWIVLGLALVFGVGIGAMIAITRSSAAPETPISPASAADAAPMSWPAGKQLAPGFSLRNEDGGRISLKQFRGRNVIVTFIDPLCRNLCPFEAKTLASVVANLPPARRPAIIAVSTNRWANARSNLLLDKTKWHLPSDWHWAVGSPTALARVWRAYAIGVSAATKTIAGVKVHRITHTEASYVVDPTGHERALYLYPFHAPDVEQTLRSLSRA
jgi:cytochrome oxidase Cu insertion factor (SCO1/SenC/PrrC family)